MKKLRLKGIVVVTALSIILTGCQSKEEVVVNKEEQNTSVVEQTIQPTIEENTIIEETPTQTESTEEIIVPSESTQTMDNFTFFEDAKQEIISYIESEEFETLKTKGKYYITTGIDFIFFDQPINGIYFDQMTEELKKDNKNAMLFFK